jgi:hypothetical protein
MKRFRVVFQARRMGLFLATCVLPVVGTSCLSHTKTAAPSSPFLYPSARFVGQGSERVLDRFVAMGITTNQLREDLATIQSPTEYARSLADPFVCESLPFVCFESFDPAERIAAYYEALFRASGWQEIRGPYPLEGTNCGGDWLKVYRNESQQVLLHVCGVWERLPEENEQAFVVRLITFRFLGLQPEKLLGQFFCVDDSERYR